VVDAVPVRHDTRPTASTYRWQDAIATAHEFLAGHEHLRYAEAERTLATYTRLPPEPPRSGGPDGRLQT
jgi:hypothetical protein